MSSHPEEPPVDLGDTPPEEDVDTASASDDAEEDPNEKLNYTERHPEHFRNPPGHVRDLREGEEAP